MRETTARFWLGRLNAVRLSGLSGLSPRRALLTALALLPLLLPGCGGGGDAAEPGPPKLTSISVSPSVANLGVGQSQSITVEARDQSGQIMSGIVFTWASSNSSVASVAGGVATGVAPGAADITASSGGVVSNAASLQVSVVAMGSVAIDKPSVFLSATGQSAQLAAQRFDAQGVAAAGAVAWSSSAPDKVSVDAAGRLVAVAIGSAQIFATGGGARSAPTLVVVAVPQAGALLVTDAQVVAVGPPLRLAAGASPGIGTEYEVTLQGVATPAPGTVVLAAQTAPVAGKVVATRQEAAGLVVTLALAPLHELLSAYDIDWTIDLSALAHEEVPDVAVATAQGAVWERGSLTRPGTGRALAQARAAADVIEPFKAFTCKASIKPQVIDKPIQLAVDNKLQLTWKDQPGYSKHALEGTLAIIGTAGITLKAGAKATGRCDAQRQIKLNATGWLKLLPLPAVRFGLGVQLNAEVLLVQADLGVDGRIELRPTIGWECGGASASCRALDGIAVTDKFKTKSKFPSENDMQAKVSAQFYAVAGLDAELAFGAIKGSLVEARMGPKQSFDLAFAKDQAARRDYAATYDLKLAGVVEPGSGLKKAIEAFIKDDFVDLKFGAATSEDISESPKGSLSVSKAKLRTGQTVDFTVDLVPKSAVYWELGYNVIGVELYRKRDDEAEFSFWKFMELISTYRATYKWTPAANEVGTYEFAAFATTKVPEIPLEIAPDSIRSVEVACAIPGALSGNTASRAKIQSATAQSGGARPLANQCVDAWAGTATYVIKTPGLPAANIAVRSNLTWTLDPVLSGNGATYYNASGTFTVVFNRPDTCTTVLTPDTFAIAPDLISPGRLGIISNGVTPATYGFGGAQFVTFTSTVSCPGSTTVVTEFRNFQVSYASGNGDFTAGQERLIGSTDDAAISTSWDFIRQ